MAIVPERPIVAADALALEVECYLEIVDHFAAIKWFLEAGELDLGTTLDYAARHLRLAIAACDRGRLG